MESLSIELRSARERKNISLRQIADDTRISLRHLQNLEEGRYSELPGGMYNRAFLRAYCEYVGLDFNKMRDRYEAESLQPSQPQLHNSLQRVFRTWLHNHIGGRS